MPPVFDVALRSQALTLHAQGASRQEIQQKTGYSPQGFGKLLTKAKSRGYVVGSPVLLKYVENGKRKGRPQLHENSQRKKLPKK
ncbi:hypothetical protein F4775DRAFT_578822 [Biscogniauxia sp. FL1348]|nr:hypothetical protein F4775DRAFT_578822 [Biscogniauxia sp. FL1348]